MKKTVRHLFFLLFLFSGFVSFGQRDFYADLQFSAADSLRGSLRPERTCYDVTHYDLSIELFIDQRRIVGSNTVSFTVVEDCSKIQLDLFQNMHIDRILHGEKELTYQRIADAVFVDVPDFRKGSHQQLSVYFRGKPRTAKRPPWDGGFTWTTDSQGLPWVAVSCQGVGASLWWPNKDHLSDEPDSMDIALIVPSGLHAVSNGRLLHQEKLTGDRKAFQWHVSYPINNYNVTLNVGAYSHFQEYHDSLELDYYVLPENIEKAKKHFGIVPEMHACFEQYLGEYPFPKDGYALVETPFLGMEHQGAIAYGNQYKRGYMGGRIPEGMNWDYIIVHESAHEYWGNSVSCTDNGEMWLHEAFTTYMEALYVECRFGYEKYLEYLQGQRNLISNQKPMMGPLDVNYNKVTADIYYKGSWMLHTLRTIIDDDAKWFSLLKDFYRQHAYGFVTTDDFVRHVREVTGVDYGYFFEQYLYYPDQPSLLYRLKKKCGKLTVSYKWMAGYKGFQMPVLIGKKGNYTKVYPTTTEWKEITLKRIKPTAFRVAVELLYVESTQMD